jgi:hypothetical protein
MALGSFSDFDAIYAKFESLRCAFGVSLIYLQKSGRLSVPDDVKDWQRCNSWTPLQ